MSAVKPKGKSKESKDQGDKSSKDHSKEVPKEAKKPGKKDPNLAPPQKGETHSRIPEDKDGKAAHFLQFCYNILLKRQ